MPPAWHKAPAVAPIPHQPGCTGKRAYASRADCIRAARIQNLTRVYRCEHCRGWHMSSQGRFPPKGTVP